MNNEQKINDFMNHMPESITKRQKKEIFESLFKEINSGKQVDITISEDYSILTAKIIEGNTTTTQTIDIKKMIPKKKNKFIEWLNS